MGIEIIGKIGFGLGTGAVEKAGRMWKAAGERGRW